MNIAQGVGNSPAILVGNARHWRDFAQCLGSLRQLFLFAGGFATWAVQGRLLDAGTTGAAAGTTTAAITREAVSSDIPMVVGDLIAMVASYGAASHLNAAFVDAARVEGLCRRCCRDGLAVPEKFLPNFGSA